MLPTPEQERMLRFAIAAEDAEVPWPEIRSYVERADFGPSTFALVPLLSRRLDDLGLDGPLVSSLRGAYKRTWYRNHLLVRRLDEAFGVLEDAGVEPVLTGGAAIAVGFARKLELRPIDALELIVAPDAFERARAALSAGRWVKTGDGSWRLPEGSSLVIRTRVLEDFPANEDTERALLEAVVRRGAGGVGPRLLPADGELLVACLDRYRSEPWRRVQWVLDALTTLEAHPFEGDRFARQVVARRAVRATMEALTYLRGISGRQDLDPLLGALAGRRPDAREQFTDALDRAPRRVFGAFPSRVAAHLRADRAAALPASLRDEWGLPSTLHVPVEIAAKAISRLRRAAAPPAPRQ